ncbi:MAG: UpxY family transcription antiterminator [Prolixibacteraceae bacterium]|jgi:transcription antitermination factor NusG|nr:UpxY family transcription antiterminator [Prolixibacteraceae bacterium]
MEKIIPKQVYHWHAVYTKSRAEKKAKAELSEQGIEVFLPLQRKLRQWSDRKKWVEVPLISGYLFVYISRKEYDKVLWSNYVVTYVRFQGTAAIIPDQQIEYLKMMLKQDVHEVSVTTEQLEPGREIEVMAGPMIGMRAVLVRIHGKNKVAVQIEQMGFAALVELPLNDIRAV